jgi:excisionase family DNA binding protein
LKQIHCFPLLLTITGAQTAGFANITLHVACRAFFRRFLCIHQAQASCADVRTTNSLIYYVAGFCSLVLKIITVQRIGKTRPDGLTDERLQGIMGHMDRDDLVSVADAAKRLGVTRQRVHTLITNGQLKAVRLGHYRYIEAVELDRYLALPRGRPFSPRSTLNEDSIDKCK